jgi:acyl-CoA dehydrogenase
MAPYYRALGRFSSAFAVMTDMSMFVLGGSLKRRERISARLGDILSQMYLISATLKRFEDDGRPPADAPYVHWSVQDALMRTQQALTGVLDNFPNRPLALLLRTLLFPFGLPHSPPSDQLGGAVAQAMQTGDMNRERLLADCFVADDPLDPIACGEMALALLPAVDVIEKRLKPLIRSGILAPIPQNLTAMLDWIAAATSAGSITVKERQTMSDFAQHTAAQEDVDKRKATGSALTG